MNERCALFVLPREVKREPFISGLSLGKRYIVQENVKGDVVSDFNEEEPKAKREQGALLRSLTSLLSQASSVPSINRVIDMVHCCRCRPKTSTVG